MTDLQLLGWFTYACVFIWLAIDAADVLMQVWAARDELDKFDDE